MVNKAMRKMHIKKGTDVDATATYANADIVEDIEHIKMIADKIKAKIQEKHVKFNDETADTINITFTTHKMPVVTGKDIIGKPIMTKTIKTNIKKAA